MTPRLWLLVLLPWLLLAACSDSDGVGAPVVAGLDAQDGELVEFLESLRHAVRAEPDSGVTRGRLGMAYEVNDFTAAAEATYAQAQVLDPVDFRWPYYRATTLALLTRYEDALRALEQAIAIDSTYAAAWLWRGAWLLDLDRYEEAAQAYGHAAVHAREPAAAAAATVGTARTLLRQERAGEAADVLEELASRFDHPYVLQLLRNAYRRLGRLEDLQRLAQGRNDEAASLNWPDERQREKAQYVRGFSGRMLLAKKLLVDKRLQESLEILEPMREQAPDDRDLLNNLGVAYRLTDRPEEAFEVLRHGLAVHPDFHFFHFNIAVLYEQSQQNDLALRHLDRALETAPDLISAHELKVKLLIDMARFEEALATFAEAARYVEPQPNALYNAGMVAGALEQWPSAIESFQQAVSLEPGLERGHLFLGRALAEVGRFDEARAAFMQAEQLGVAAEDLGIARARLNGLEQ